VSASTLARFRPHVGPVILLAVMSLAWTWPLARHFHDHVPGLPGDNFSFLWNLWWMREALHAPDLSFFHSNYLFSPFGVDLVNHPHTALPGVISATALAGFSVIEAENAYIIVSVFLNAACAYALVFDMTRERRMGLLAAFAFGGSPYVAAHLLGHFDLLTAWVIPLFALLLRRAFQRGGIAAAIGCGLCVTVAAYSAYYYVVYLGVFAVAYALAWWSCCHLRLERRSDSAAGFSLRLMVAGLLVLDVFVVMFILMTGGASFVVAGVEISARSARNPLLVMWVLALAWLLTRWSVALRFERPPSEEFWRVTQTLMITTAVFAVLCMPLIIQGFRLAMSGRYVSQAYFWRSAPRGVDPVSVAMGNPFHPLVGGAVSRLYETLGLDRIEGVGWIGVVPFVVLLMGRGKWLDRDEARRWKVVLVIFAIWALGPFLMLAGFDLGLPLPQSLARFVPLVENARMPGRAMVCVYLSLGVLMALRVAAFSARTAAESLVARPVVQWALVAGLALDYLHAPIPLTALERPVVYEHLASIEDSGGVIEAPFGIGDGLSTGAGSQDRRMLYYATIHGHPVVGGYIGRMPPGVAQAYHVMPFVGNLLRLSSGQEAVAEELPLVLPFRYLVLDTRTASPELVEYIRSSLDLDLIASGDGRELYAVQGPKPANRRAAK
jgi:hypothetical protein